MLKNTTTSTTSNQFTAPLAKVAVTVDTSAQPQTEPLTYIIEDDRGNNLLCKIILNEVGVYNTASFFMANVALNDLKERMETKQAFPTVILLDINMPAMNGWDFLDAYRKFPDSVTQHTKILMFSTYIHPSHIAKAIYYPEVLDYIEKPLSEEAASVLKQKYLCTAA